MTDTIENSPPRRGRTAHQLTVTQVQRLVPRVVSITLQGESLANFTPPNPGGHTAVPGLFTPKVHDGHRYVDGAVASATHASILAGEDLDAVLISSPMTRAGRGPIRGRARRQLSAEVATLHANGIRTIVVTPTTDVVAAAEGFPRRNPESGAAIVAAARDQTISAFADLRATKTIQRSGATPTS